MSGDTTDNESYHGYSVDDEDQPQGEGDSLVDDRGLTEPLDEGYSPPEKWSAAQGYGNTPLEESQGESLDQRVDQEVPEPDPYDVADAEAARGDLAPLVAEDSSEGEAVQADLDAAEADGDRAGRLVAEAEGVRTDANMIPSMLEAAREEATLGEICDALRAEWGEYREPARF